MGESGRLAVYARVSTGDQEFEAQIERCRTWADAHGFEVFEVFAEVASGRDSDRPEQASLMEAAMLRRVHAVACAKIDRWARSLSHLSRSVGRLHERGVEFVAVDQGLRVQPGDPTGELILNVLGAVAQWEAQIISERTKEALAEKKRRGESLGRPTEPCACCGGEREAGSRAWVAGKTRPVCRECQGLDAGDRARLLRERGGG